MSRILLALSIVVLFLFAAPTGEPLAAQLTACTAGATTCGNDTANDAAIVNAINDPIFQARVWWLWLQQCNFIYSEATSTTGHAQRVSFCQAIASDTGPGNTGNRVPMTMLVAAIINSTVESEILAGSGSPAAGNVVDTDINTAIDSALTVSGTPVSTTATQATTGLNNFTVASATGIAAGMTVAGPGIPTGATVTEVSGTTVVISQGITAALATSPVSFATLSGLATRVW
jgi:hypothetical protein